jgi:glycerol uptake facilitator-like aquaporin
MVHANPLVKRLVGEGLGTAFLLAAIVGSGIMGDRLAGGNVAIALLANAVATGAGLVALILTFGPISGAHFNPLVSLFAWWHGQLPRSDTLSYVVVQMGGAVVGVIVAHAMFGEPTLALSTHVRSGVPQVLSEAVATFGLLGTIVVSASRQPATGPFAVGAFITSAYWFTASTSFANPAVTVARSLTDTFAGIRPADVPMFLAGQLLGLGAAALVFRWLLGSKGEP